MIIHGNMARREDVMAELRNIRTDLTLEAHELLREKALKEQKKWQDISGVEVENEGDERIRITRVRVTSRTGEISIGKPMGNYITLEIPGLKENDRDLYEDACRALAKELTGIMKLNDNTLTLVVGLGNWNVTPDALGPKVVSNMMVTRHLLEYLPDQ